MQFPAIYLLVALSVFAGVSTLFFGFNIYHIAKFGARGTKTNIILGIYIVLFIVTILFSVSLLLPYNWDQDFQFRAQIAPGQIQNISL